MKWMTFAMRAVGAACLALPVAARAAEYHVDAAKGDDSRTSAAARNAETPWATLKKATKALKPGDTLLVHEGEYKESLSVRAKGTAEKPVTVKAVGNVVIRDVRILPPEFKPVEGHPGIWWIDDPGPIRAMFEDPETTHLVVEEHAYVGTLENLAKRSSGPGCAYDMASKRLFVRPGHKPLDPNKHKMVVSRINRGLDLRGEHIRVEGFRVEYASVGAYFRGRSNTVSGLWAYHCGWGANMLKSHGTLERSVIVSSHHGIQARGTHLTIRNNTLFGTRAQGLWISKTASGRIVNNILWAGGASGQPVRFHNGKPKDLTMDYNLWPVRPKGTSAALVHWHDGTVLRTLDDIRAKGYASHGILTHPLFVKPDRVNPDLHLQSTAAGFPEDSPCIGAGTPEGTHIGALPPAKAKPE